MASSVSCLKCDYEMAMELQPVASSRDQSAWDRGIPAQILNLKKKIIFFKCLGVLPTCMSVYYMHTVPAEA